MWTLDRAFVPNSSSIYAGGRQVPHFATAPFQRIGWILCLVDIKLTSRLFGFVVLVVPRQAPHQPFILLKPSAASPHLMQHTGRAVVFESVEEFHTKIHDPNLDVDENCILVLKNCGPKGYPGMAEVGNMILPQKVLKKGVRDMIRISDARMSGTAYGTVILHTSPEAAIKGPLAAVQNGDLIEVDVNNGKLQLEVPDEVIAKIKRAGAPKLAE